MIQLVDLTLFQEKKMSCVAELLRRHKASLLYAHHLNWDVVVTIINGLAVADELHTQKGSVKYVFMKSGYLYYFQVVKFLLKSKPDILLLHGFRYFPWVVLFRLLLPSSIKFVFQHHAEKVPRGLKGILLKVFFKMIDAVLFNSKQQADEWKGLIKEKNIYVIPEGTNDFSCRNFSRDKHSFIWVGRLNNNKDPLCLLNAFERFLNDCPQASLTMIYRDDVLVELVKAKIETSSLLKNSVTLIKDFPNDRMEEVYNKARFFISTSHYESGGYSFIESIACGCVPIVSAIPAFNDHIKNIGVNSFKPGNVDELYNCLLSSDRYKGRDMHMKVSQYFTDQLSPVALGKRMGEICFALNER